MKKKLIIANAICYMFLLLFLIIYTCSWISDRIIQREEMLRGGILQRWYNETKAYCDVQGTTPSTLYDVAFYQWITNDKYMNVPDVIYLGAYYEAFPDEEKTKLKESDFFMQKVDFEIVIMRNKWFIVEKTIHDQYPFFMMINQDGEIYKSELITKAPDFSRFFKNSRN